MYNFMLKQHQIFFDFLRFCIGSESEIPSSLKEADWKELYVIAQKQCLVGVLFDGIKKLPAEYVEMKKKLLLQWMAESQMLEKANVRLNDAAIQVSEWFRKKEFRTCILKEQGNALMYPNPYSRTPGDIDIWVEGGDKRVISFVRSISPQEEACYHHIEFPSYKGVEVEAWNLGKHDERNRFGRSKLGHNLQRVYRDMRLMRYFPGEALCDPVFRI